MAAFNLWAPSHKQVGLLSVSLTRTTPLLLLLLPPLLHLSPRLVSSQTDSACPTLSTSTSTPPPLYPCGWSPPVVRIRVGRESQKRGAPLERTLLPRSPRDASTYRTGFLGSGSVSHLNKQCRRWRRVNGVKKKLSIRQSDTSTR